MSIYATLIKDIKMDDNGNRSNLDKRYMNIELLIEPKQHTLLILPNHTSFFISNLIQDLVERRIILLEVDEICHRKFWDPGFYPKYLKKLKDEGWLDEKPKSTLP